MALLSFYTFKKNDEFLPKKKKKDNPMTLGSERCISLFANIALKATEKFRGYTLIKCNI
jgi:hypothetical protein